MAKQKDIAIKLKVTPAYISQILKGDRPVTWNIAERLAEIFPERDVEAWKKTPPAQIKSAFK